MARFHFRAVTGTGEVLEESRRKARRRWSSSCAVRGTCRSPRSWSAPAPGLDPSEMAAPARVRRQAGASPRLVVMTRELATLLDAGLTVDQSLRLLEDLATSEAMRRMLADLLQGSVTLADALGQYEDVFSRAYVSMVRAGEAGGSLNDVLNRLAQYLDQAELLTEQVRSALVYPIVLLVMSGLSIVVLLTAVVPQHTLFESAGAELPLLTRVVITTGDAAATGGCCWSRCWPASGWIGGSFGRSSRPGSTAGCYACRCRQPPIKIDTARLARTLGTLLANGVPLLQRARDRQGERRILREALSETTTGQGRPRAGRAAGPIRSVPAARDPPARGRRKVRPSRGHAAEIAEIFDREVRSTLERLMTLLARLTIGLGLIIASIIGAVLAAILSAYQLPL